MNLTHYWANKRLDFEFRTAALAKPTQWWLALFIVAPTAVASSGTEVIGGAYARLQNNPSDTNWTATQGGTVGVSSGTLDYVTNAITLTYAAPTADWGTINGAALFDASTAGNMLYWSDFALASPVITPFAVKTGEGAVTFAPGAIVVRNR